MIFTAARFEFGEISTILKNTNVVYGSKIILVSLNISARTVYKLAAIKTVHDVTDCDGWKLALPTNVKIKKNWLKVDTGRR